jgi:hypothetical protein
MADTWRSDAPPTPHRFDWKAIRERLVKRPDEWMLGEKGGSRSIAGAIRTGRIATLRDPDWEFLVRVRQTKGNNGDIWMSAHKRGMEDATTAGDD